MNEEGRDLELFLREVSRSVVEHLEASLASGALFRSAYDTLHRGVNEYRYSIGLSELEISLLPTTVEQCIWRDKAGFVSEVISSCTGLAEGIESIMGSLRPTLGRLSRDKIVEASDLLAQKAVDHLSVFILTLTDRLLDASPDQVNGVADVVVSEFLRDLRREPHGWDIKAYIKCLWLEEECCPLGEGFVLRRPTLDDYRCRRWVEGVSWNSLSEIDVDRIGTTVGAVLEMRCGPCTEAEAREEFDVLLDALRLFRVASLSREHLHLRPLSVLSARSIAEEDEGKAPIYHAVLRASDQEDLLTFLRNITPLVHHHPFQRFIYSDPMSQARNVERMRQRYSQHSEGHLPEEQKRAGPKRTGLAPSPEDIAFHLYRSALLDIMVPEERLAKLISGLEGLYLLEDRGVDRKRAVALRTSSLLEGWSFDPVKVARDIRDGMMIRGDLYGGENPGRNDTDVAVLCENLAEYLRASLVIFYQARLGLEREELIAAMDLLVQGRDLPDKVARVLEKVFVNEAVPQPYR